jgi:starch phosphorylase
VRDVLSLRWIRTEQTYDRANPKRIYYISIEFLLGRSLANNIENLLLDSATKQLIKDKTLDWLGLLEREPDPGLGNGGLGRLAACFPGFDGDDATPRDGLRAALRIRNV